MVQLFRIVTVCLLLIVTFAIFLPCPAPAQQLAKRLILKDGSFQLVTKYEIHGDRVHYFSAERSDWEDLPNSMVDWDATIEFEKDRATGSPVPEAVQLDREMAAERQAEESKSPEVAPRLRLPEDGEVYLLDTFQNGAELVELQPSNAEINRDAKRNVLRAAVNPIASSKQIIEIQGQHSKIQAHVTLPSVYIKVQDEQNDQQKPDKAASTDRDKSSAGTWDRFRIVRLRTEKDKRILGNLKVAVYGKVSQQQDFVSARIQPLTEGWMKITPSNDLTDGEYAVVEMMDKGQLSSAVWDFGINPSAPVNALVIKPEGEKPTPPSNQQKQLQTRKPD